ncbi:MAG: hypothetical protein R2708_07685 [Vicinamibacterales bacterium]
MVEVRLPGLTGWASTSPTRIRLRATCGSGGPRLRRRAADARIYKGGAASHLEVSVDVSPGDVLPAADPAVMAGAWTADVAAPDDPEHATQEQQQQQ